MKRKSDFAIPLPKRGRGRGLPRGRGRGLPRGRGRGLPRGRFVQRRHSSPPKQVRYNSPTHRIRRPMAMRFQSQTSTETPFGFDIEPFKELVSDQYQLGLATHTIHNTIQRFNENKPIFARPSHRYLVEKENGLEAMLKIDGPPKDLDDTTFIRPKSLLHTPHTVSMYRMAHKILIEIRKQPICTLQNESSNQKFTVDISKAIASKRHGSEDIVYNGATYMGESVVLKTTRDVGRMLKYVLEAYIHTLLMMKVSSYVPELKFVKMTREGRLVLCSKQLQIPPVCTWLSTLHTKHPRGNRDALALHMLRGVCLSIRRLQINAHFTHRDTHTNNVYYDETTRQIQFIDFDFSAIIHHQVKISVPVFLYDTTRPVYAKNRSLDMCIFLRNMAPYLSHVPHFAKHIYAPIMSRYEAESKQILFEKMADDTAAMQLYKMCTDNGSLKGHFSHAYGIEKTKNEFEYRMGYYEWPSMIPESILELIDTNREKIFK